MKLTIALKSCTFRTESLGFFDEFSRLCQVGKSSFFFSFFFGSEQCKRHLLNAAKNETFKNVKFVKIMRNKKKLKRTKKNPAKTENMICVYCVAFIQLDFM